MKKREIIFLFLCIFIISGVYAFCGNNAVNLGEACDGTDLNKLSCSSFPGFKSGILKCNSDCSGYDVSNCVAGNVINAKSCNLADVQTAINSAEEGDTILVPAGECNWNSNLIISKGLVLMGAGINKTKINSVWENPGNGDVGLIDYRPSNPSLKKSFRLTGFSLNANLLSDVITLRNYDISPALVRIDNNEITDAGGIYGRRRIRVRGTIYGVIDNNIFSGEGGALSSYGLHKTSWDNLVFNYGSADNIYFEDNFIHVVTGSHAGGQGGRYAIRYNDYLHTRDRGLYPWYDAHGNQARISDGVISCNVYGTMGIEIYGNQMNHTYTRSGIGIVDHRGGKGLVFNNNVLSSTTTTSKLREEYNDSFCPTINPQPQHVSDAYYWNNRGANTKLVNFYIDHDYYLLSSKIEHDPPVLVSDVTHFNHKVPFDGTSGMGCGTLKDRPTTCKTGTGYWATDQPCDRIYDSNVGANPENPIKGILYKCVSTNNWQIYYIPYVYPHPLRLNDSSIIIPIPENETDFPSETSENISDIVTVQDMLGAYQQYKRNEVSLIYFLDKLRRWIVFW